MVGYTIDSVVREYLIESGDDSEHRYTRLLQIAHSGLRELNMDVGGTPKAVLLPVNANDTVDLPLDYITYLKIGICGINGNFHSLGWNDQMCFNRDFDDCGVPRVGAGQSTSDGVLWGGYDGDFHRNGEITGRLFGIGGGNNENGYYRIDEALSLIQIQDSKATEIWLEYLADYSQIDNEHKIHPYEVEALKAWMYWKDIQRNRTWNMAEKQEAKHNYKIEKGQSQRRHGAFTLSEALQSIRKANQASPKF